MKSLLPVTAAVPIFAPLQDQRCGVVFYDGCGNAGDRLIELATLQLLERFEIEYFVCGDDGPLDADVLLLGSGGNYGHPNCGREASIRARARATDLPCVLLPVTAYGSEPLWRSYRQTFVRDVASLAYIHGATLAPDLVMCWQPPRPARFPHLGRGEFFSRLEEGYWPGRGTDPRHDFSDGLDYFYHVAEHREIVTDSLHAAICGLIAGRDVTLCPTRLHKQRSMYDTWLRHLGCTWRDTPE